jgi:DNA-binding protein HU-beta
LTRGIAAPKLCRDRGVSLLASRPRVVAIPFPFSSCRGASSVNKNDLIDAVASESDLRKSDATKAVDAVFKCIEISLKKGEEVRLVGFGTFAVSQRAASQGRNPRTGEPIQIPASKQVKFKAGKGFKDAVQ